MSFCSTGIKLCVLGVATADPERNYHIFYQLCAGASPEEVESLKLKPASEFHYLNQSKCYELSGVRYPFRLRPLRVSSGIHTT